jgi:ABC-type phosphate transport system substrate-binding protein
MNARGGRQVIVMMFGVVLLSAVACTALLDRSSVQCRSDDDCVHFGHHPYCEQSVCVASGLSPRNCFFGTAEHPPMALKEFLNGCSPNALGGENSALGECLSFGKTSDPEAALKEPMTGSPPPPVPAARPTTLCREVAPNGTVLYMAGSSNFPPLLEKLAAIITANTDLRVTPVFKTTSSCAGIRSMLQSSPTYGTDHVIRDPPANSAEGYAQYVSGGKLTDCLLGPGGAAIEVGESEIYAETCGYAVKDADNVAESQGPILPILFVVPGDSEDTVISAAAARQVFGTGGLAPWSDWRRFYVRGAGTATQQLVGREIGVPANKFWGLDQGTAQILAAGLAVSTNYSAQSIGILGADFYDRDRGNLKALAFQAKDQDCAYLPDSSSGSTDKINVRDGHYPIWGPMHFFVTESNLTYASPAASEFVGLFAKPTIPVEMLDALIDSSFVPQCAMMVRRDGEVGLAPDASGPPPSLIKHVPPHSCGCRFDAVATKTAKPPNCDTCTLDGNCPKHQVCNYGFCELEPN